MTSKSKVHILEAGPLRVEFARHADRWGHVIGPVDNGDFRPLLESAEGAPDDLWPSSPPCQELHIERRGNHSVALLVGQTTKCHWSLSIEPWSEKPALQFDVACRVPSADALGTLASAYRSLAGKPTSAAADHSQCTWANGFVVRAQPGSSLWENDDGDVVIEADPEAFNFPATFRWQYLVRAEHSD